MERFNWINKASLSMNEYTTKNWLIIRTTYWILQLDFIWNWLVTNGRVQWPWRILDIFLSNYQCEEYTFFWMIQEFPRPKKVLSTVIRPVRSHVCLCSVPVRRPWCAALCAGKEHCSSRHWPFRNHSWGKTSLPRSRTPMQYSRQHATGQTKGLVKDKWMLREEWLTK